MKKGFTLIELLTVMALMVLMMGLSMAAFFSFKKDAAMRSSLLQTKAGLGQARQWAVTRRVRTFFRYGNSQTSVTRDEVGYYVISTNTTGGDVSVTNWLAPGIVFADDSGSMLNFGGTSETIEFKLDGTVHSSGGYNRMQFMLVEREATKAGSDHALTNTIEVLPLTGMARIVD